LGGVRARFKIIDGWGERCGVERGAKRVGGSVEGAETNLQAIIEGQMTTSIMASKKWALTLVDSNKP
jgi:hypothetical protein